MTRQLPLPTPLRLLLSIDNPHPTANLTLDSPHARALLALLALTLNVITHA